MNHVAPLDPNDPWYQEVRRDELDRPLNERPDPDTTRYGLGKLGSRLNDLARSMAMLGERAALHWIDITEDTFNDWPEVTRVRLLRDHLDHPRWEEFTPRNEPDKLPVRYPSVTMWEGTVENTINDPYIDGFEPWAPVWSPAMERAFSDALTRVAHACPDGVSRDDLVRARRAVLGTLAVRLEGDRLREVIDEPTTEPIPSSPIRPRL